MNSRNGFLLVALAGVLLAGCERKPTSTAAPESSADENINAASVDPLAFVLVAHKGSSAADREIQKFQKLAQRGINQHEAIERLGWAFVAKAHESFDPGFYKLAEACANILETDSPGCAEGLLLRGHVLQNLHRFAEAEQLAHELVAQRGLSYDFALLGDTLMEQGRLAEAVPAYQQMADIRPDPQAYARIAHVRWLTGDLDGAIAMLQAAAGAGSPNDADSAAWINSRLANLQLQSGDAEAARQTCDEALALRPDYPAALLLRGKMALELEDLDAAIADLQKATQGNPLPEYQWALADALRAAERDVDADTVEGLICRRGAEADPRSLSLYLATRGQDTDLAVRLAEQELSARADVFTHGALAWALSAAGRHEEARARIQQALSENTVDARLFFHAAVIASRAGVMSDAEKFFTRAVVLKDLLLPSEQALLLKLPDDFALAHTDDDTSTSSAANTLSASGL